MGAHGGVRNTVRYRQAGRPGDTLQGPAGERLDGEPQRRARRQRAVSALAWALAGAILFAAYLRQSQTVAETSDMANILLMANDMLHGNLLLHGWYTSDVSFYTTELPQYVLLESFLGLRMETAHIAGAITYTLTLGLAVLLARGGAASRQATIRALIVAGIMLVPLQSAVFALLVAVGHIGTSVPLLLCWVLLDRAGRRWWVGPLTCALLTWTLIADELVLVAAVVPLGLVAAGHVIAGLARPVRRQIRWHELRLAAAAGAAPLLARAAEDLLRAHGGYVQAPVPVVFRTSLHALGAGAQDTWWAVLILFGADYRTQGIGVAAALLHFANLAVVLVGLLLVASRFFKPGRVALVDQVLFVAIVGLLAAYLTTGASVQGAREIGPLEPFAAALAARAVVPAALAATRHRRIRARLATTGWLAGGLVLAGYLAGLGYAVTQPAEQSQYVNLASWLEAHHLRHGLSTYWWASSVTVTTGGRVTIRATRPPTHPYLWMSDGAWYDSAKATASFVVLGPQQPAPTAGWTKRGLAADFGHPARVYRTGPFTIFVWNYNLLTRVRR